MTAHRLGAWGVALALLAVAVGAGAQAPGPVAANLSSTYPPGTVVVYNRPVVVFRAPFMGLTPQERATNATERVDLMLSRGGEGKVTLQDAEQGTGILIDGQLAFIITTQDGQATPGENARTLGEVSKRALERIAEETREARDAAFLTRAAAFAVAATVVWLLLMWLARRVWLATARRLMQFAHRQAERIKVGGEGVVSRAWAITSARRIAAIVAIATMLLLTWEWLGFVLGRFPYTRPWSESLTGFLVSTALGVLTSIARALPSLFVAVVIFTIAWFVNRMVRRFFDGIAAGRVAFGGFDRDTAPPTKRLATIVIWLFAAAMAYPYIPGSDTDAFKGLSVLLGLMVSIGASSIVGQAASGLILMYTRTYRSGEYVKIGDREGTVVRMGLFTTMVRTGMGEELTLPNSQVLSTVTTNYSRTNEGAGFMVSAAVSIGYDAPWRQVHAMLEEAARRTKGIEDTPPPRVFQTRLDDFYVQYQLVCRGSAMQAFQRAVVISALHASIQDVFNEHGVQIMSPHYLGDPDHPKIVPKAKWHEPPAAS